MKMIVTNETRRCAWCSARHSEFFPLTFLIRRLWRAHTMHAARSHDGMQIPPAGREQSERIARVRFFASRAPRSTTHISCVDASARLCARRWPFKETSLHRSSVNPNVRLARLLSNKLVASSWKRLLPQKCHAAFNCFIFLHDYFLCVLYPKLICKL